MAKTRIFLSYSHQNLTQMRALESALAKKGLTVCTDSGHTHTPQLHREISSNLNKSDIVVPLVTTEWLHSHECRDELVRANERRKTIIPFRHKAVSDDGPPKLPWFLREMLHISWDEETFDSAVGSLLTALADATAESWRWNSYRDLRQIGDDIQQSHATESWQQGLCQRILGIAKRQVHDVLVTPTCSFDVSNEHSYLRFAEPIFSEARTIVAICIASISTFWTNTHFRSDAGRYLKSQKQSAESISRLFVFESVAEVMQFREILHDHHNTYGNDRKRSGVFLCSVASYRRLLTKWARQADAAALRQDFGILSFQESDRHMWATLDPQEFRYQVYDDDDVAQGKQTIILEYFKAMRALGFGKVDPASNVARWSPEWARSGAKLAECLETLFNDRCTPITHLVLLRAEQDSEQISDYLYQLSSRFHAERAALRLVDMSVMRRRHLSVSDGRYSAALRLWEVFDYALVMRFDDETSLKHYYQHELHSLEREKLYVLLNPAVEADFAEARALDRSQIDRRAELFSAIERRMTEGEFIRRVDISDCEPLSHFIDRMTTQPGPTPR